MARTKTWEDECLSRVVIRNQEGDIGLCVLWNLLDDVLPSLPAPEEFPRLSTVGNLRTPLGISWFLRGLGQLPHVTTVVVWGSDLTRTGKALFALWGDGADDNHSVPHFSWRLDPLVNRGSIDRFRREVELIDARSIPLGELAQFLLELPEQALVRQKLLFPPVELPERTILPSRGGSVQLLVRNPADGWIRIQHLIASCGLGRVTRKGEQLGHLFDVKVVMPVPEREAIGPPFDFGAADFEVYYADFISPEPPPLGTEYRYGERFWSWRNHNQLEEVIARLQNSPDTKRATIVLLDPTDLDELEDAPCLALGTFCIQEGVLSSSWVVRSHDMYSGWPFNILSLLRVHRLVAERVGVSPLGYASFLSNNAQIYERHFLNVEENLERWGSVPEDFGPDYHFDPDPAGNFVFGIVGGQVRMTMTNPNGDQVLVERTHGDPLALVLWVVHTMPWLARQHVRYLGQEQEKLRRALEKNIPYVQG